MRKIRIAIIKFFNWLINSQYFGNIITLILLGISIFVIVAPPKYALNPFALFIIVFLTIGSVISFALWQSKKRRN